MTADGARSGPLSGVLSVLSTPFTDDGGFDEASLLRLVEHNLTRGVHGIVCFGLAGEVYKLTDGERRRILELTVETIGGAVPVVAGTEHNSVEAAVQRSVEAQELGVDALMMYPPTFVKPDLSAIFDYYVTVADAVDLPIIVQDAPAWTGVTLPVDLLAAIHREAPTVRYVKVEAPPTAVKIAALREVGFEAVGGYGALHLAEELEADIVGFMPGCAMPSLYTQLWRHHQEDDRDGLWSLFTQALPLLSFQLSSLDTFVSVQKILLHRLGVQSSPRLRSPGQSLDDTQTAWLDQVLDRTGLDRYLVNASAKAGRP